MDRIKLGSWNVNGLRACMKKGFMDFFRAEKFDILGLQEIKMLREQADFTFDGYKEYWYSAEKRGYSGTAVFAKNTPISVVYGIGVDHHDHEGRVVSLEYNKFYYINTYTPNAKRELTRLDDRMDWEDSFRSYVTDLALKKPVIICGDLNVAHKEIDLANPKSNVKSAGFTPQEREKFGLLLEAGFIDTFRYKYPTTENAYTWWSYMGNCRAKNIGWRIDYFLVSEALRGNISEARIYPETGGSDHCPVGLVLEM